MNFNSELVIKIVVGIAAIGLVIYLLHQSKTNVVTEHYQETMETPSVSMSPDPSDTPVVTHADPHHDVVPSGTDMQTGTQASVPQASVPQASNAAVPSGMEEDELVHENFVSSSPTPTDMTLQRNKYPKDCFPKDQLTPTELLPSNQTTQFAQLVPDNGVNNGNFLTAGYHVGINTVGQTLRNANRGLRSDPPNPQVKVSPWMQTTIEPDTNRKPLEIGGNAACQ